MPCPIHTHEFCLSLSLSLARRALFRTQRFIYTVFLERTDPLYQLLGIVALCWLCLVYYYLLFVWVVFQQRKFDKITSASFGFIERPIPTELEHHLPSPLKMPDPLASTSNESITIHMASDIGTLTSGGGGRRSTDDHTPVSSTGGGGGRSTDNQTPPRKIRTRAAIVRKRKKRAKITLKTILNDQSGFAAFCEHCFAELSVEFSLSFSLLFCFAATRVRGGNRLKTFCLFWKSNNLNKNS